MCDDSFCRKNECGAVRRLKRTEGIRFPSGPAPPSPDSRRPPKCLSEDFLGAHLEPAQVVSIGAPNTERRHSTAHLRHETSRCAGASLDIKRRPPADFNASISR
jgi:hypothetical protein